MILHNASQYYAADHCRCLKYGFFSVCAPSGENDLKFCSNAALSSGVGYKPI
jgi:hypothetical protein